MILPVIANVDRSFSAIGMLGVEPAGLPWSALAERLGVPRSAAHRLLLAARNGAARFGRIPLGRLVEVDEIARMVAFLCSDDCSFSTGAVFDLSGGRATY